MTTYLQVPATMTEPLLIILDKRIERMALVSRGRFMMAGAMLLLAQSDQVILDMMQLAMAQMKLCKENGK